MNIEAQVGGHFTPKSKLRENLAVWGGVTVKWFPKGATEDDVRLFLQEHGLSEDHQDVTIKENGQVVIGGLDS